MTQNKIILPKEDSIFGVSATNPEFAKIDISSLTIPQEIPDECKVATLNKTGYMTTDYAPLSKHMIDACAKMQKPVLDIGSAFGILTLPALKTGAQVIASDIDHQHLFIIREKAPKDLHKNLFLKYGRCPYDLDFPENSLSGVMISRVAHFFTGTEIEQTLSKIYSWLEPGGKLFLTMLTQYHHRLIEKFSPVYEQRWQAGEKWPGSVDNMHVYAPDQADQIPEYIHVCDSRPMCLELIKQGFIIDELSMHDYERETQKVQKSGKEYLTFIASKPL